MTGVVQGIILGLSLSILAGPLLFLYLQVGIERGFRAGAMVGVGAWFSDLCYLLAAYFGVRYLLDLVAWPGFRFYTGLLGGLLLVVIGLLLLWSHPRLNPKAVLPTPDAAPATALGQSYSGLAAKGFLINTFNPFAAFFWLGVLSTTATGQTIPRHEVKYLLMALLATIIVTDLLKVLLAKQIRRWLTPTHILQLRHWAGGILVVLGLGLAIWVVV